jgi:hypothetical protein
VDDTFRRPWKALKILLRGFRTDGPMAPEPPILYAEPLKPKSSLVGRIGGTKDSNSRRVA